MHTHMIALATEWEILDDNDLALLQVKFQSTHLLNLPKFHVESSIKRSHPHQLMCYTYGGLELVFTESTLLVKTRHGKTSSTRIRVPLTAAASKLSASPPSKSESAASVSSFFHSFPMQRLLHAQFKNS